MTIINQSDPDHIRTLMKEKYETERQNNLVMKRNLSEEEETNMFKTDFLEHQFGLDKQRK